MINDLTFHPNNPNLLLSGSSDHTAGLWNVSSKVCIAKFNGIINQSQVLAVSFDHQGDNFVTGGMDHMIVIWSLTSSEMIKAITESDNNTAYVTKRFYDPVFSTNKIHAGYVDSVIWFGLNSFISRSENGDIVWWKIGDEDDETLNFKSKIIQKLHTFEDIERFTSNRIWFVRMQVDPSTKFLCIGDIFGRLCLYDLQPGAMESAKKIYVSDRKSKTATRMISFNHDGSIMITCNEDGRVIRWDKKKCL